MKNKQPLYGMITGFIICVFALGFDGVMAWSATSAEIPDDVVTHHAEGRLRTIRGNTGWVNIDHGPIESIGWEAMRAMSFIVSDAGLLEGFKEGDGIQFVFYENDRRRYIIIELGHKE